MIEKLNKDTISLNENQTNNNEGPARNAHASVAGGNEGIEKKVVPTGIMFLLAVLVVIAVGVTSRQWIQNLKLPFLIPESERTTVTDLPTGGNLGDLVALQGKDTDNDGLSDYDELYLYNTSPYLEDSDSDSYSDFDEIQNGHDPNCPTGSICQAQGAPANLITGGVNFEDFANLSTEQLRTLLISQGMSESEVEQFDDETLRSTFQQVLEEAQQPDYFANLLTNTQIDLTPDQIRQMLITQGMAEEEVAQFSNDDLLLIWQQAMAQAQAAAGQ